MDKEFNYIIRQLETNEKIIIEILEYTSGNPIIKVKEKLNGKSMIESSGSVENWFIENIKDRGYSKIQVQLFREQGSAKIRDGRAYNFSFEKDQTDAQKTVEPSTNATPTPLGLNGAMPGLSIPDAISLNVDRALYQLSKEDLAKEKAKTERLEAEKKELEDKVKSMEKSSDNKLFVTDLAKQFAPLLQTIATKNTGAVNGLQAPAPQLPDGIRGNLIRVIMDSPHITDEQGMAAYTILKAYSDNNEAFITGLNELLNTHNYTPNGNTNNN